VKAQLAMAEPNEIINALRPYSTISGQFNQPAKTKNCKIIMGNVSKYN
jgi:hypothetical protein